MTGKRAPLVLDAGGTISARREAGGLAAGAGGELIALLARHGGAQPTVRTIHVGLSEEMTLAQSMSVVRAAVAEAQAPGCGGIVVAHGTDTLEETAFLTSLFHTAAAPIIFTGAQRAPEAADYDGGRNLAHALEVAAIPGGAGVQVVFGGAVLGPWVEKRSTVDLRAFASRGTRPARSALPICEPVQGVEIVSLSLGDQGWAITRAVRDGAPAVVIEALGRGNANAQVAAAVAHAHAQGVVVAVVSRCADGGVAPDYVTGRRLAEAGAVFCGDLSAPQARLLVSVMLATYGQAAARAALAAYVG